VHYHEQSSTKARDGNEDCAHPLHEREVRFLDILAGRVMDRIDLPSQFPPVSRLAEVLSLPNPGVSLACVREHQQGREHVHRSNDQSEDERHRDVRCPHCVLCQQITVAGHYFLRHGGKAPPYAMTARKLRRAPPRYPCAADCASPPRARGLSSRPPPLTPGWMRQRAYPSWGSGT
jgi:hypothetical protein